MRRASLSHVLRLVSFTLVATAAFAQTSTNVPLPAVRGPLPVSATDYPFGSADTYVEPMDLSARGYVEEEYIVSGEGNVYDWDGTAGEIKVRTAGVPYANRVLIRRPSDPASFSGTVIVEIFNPARRFDWPMIWGYSADHITQSGYAWVGITGPGSIAGLKQFNAARYADLTFDTPDPTASCPGTERPIGAVEQGLRWDMFAQLVASIRSNAEGRPLEALNVRRVFLATQSTELETFINVFHNRLRTGGKPLFDAYLVKSPGAPATLNNCDAPLAAGDPRRSLHGIDVPVMQVLTQGEVLASAWNRHEDSDAPGSQMRRYEIAVSAHIDSVPYRAMPRREDQIAASGVAQGTLEWPFTAMCEPEIPLQQFPLQKFVLNAAFAHLEHWVRDGVAPPRAPRITVNSGANGERMVLNDLGIAQGGIRSPYSEVPTASYITNSNGPGVCAELGSTHALTRAEIEERYGSIANYNARAREEAQKMQDAGWITAADAAELLADVTLQ